MTLEEQTQEEYDKRFDESFQEHARSMGVPPQILNRYHPEFDADAVGEFLTRNIPPYYANQFVGRFHSTHSKKYKWEKKNYRTFSSYDILKLLKENIEPSIVFEYDKGFMASHIIEFEKEGIPTQKANDFLRELKELEKSESDEKYYFPEFKVLQFIKEGLEPKDVANYPYNYDAHVIINFIKKGIKPNNKYFKYIKSQDWIVFLNKQNKFSFSEFKKEVYEIYSEIKGIISNIRKHGKLAIDGKFELAEKEKVPLEILKKYFILTKKEDIIDYYNKGMTPDKVNPLVFRFTDKEDIEEIINNNVPPEYAKKFRGHWDAWEIVYFYRKGISPDLVNSYNPIFSKQFTQRLVVNKVPAKFANSKLGGPIRRNFYKVLCRLAVTFDTGLISSLKNLISEFINEDHIVEMYVYNKTEKDIKKFNKIFSKELINFFLWSKTDSEKANKYVEFYKRSYERDNFEKEKKIVYPIEKEVPINVALSYPKGFDGLEICLAYFREIKPEDLINQNVEPKKLLYHKLTGLRLDEIDYYPQDSNFYYILNAIGFKDGKFPGKISGDVIPIAGKEARVLGFGNSGLVIFLDEKARKTNFKENREYELWQKVNLENKHKQKNIAYCKNGNERNIELEYINGKTIEQLCEGDQAISLEKVAQYSNDLLNGIFELRKAKIYHRDLNDRNILIDQENDRAVIIDLGCASDNPEEICDKTTTYGGNNDLISAAQLMYKMATGHHLFKEGPGFTCYSEVKQGIKTEREKAYENPELLQTYFQKVRQNVPGELGEKIIKLLDDDLWKQPSLEKVIEAKEKFERYLR